ncbi:hypothetical protein G7Y89_g7519 [Cudoniella acicularis]|uniref:Cytochrome P450 n=1 Tax=Cudoniella acicularis TaxID=354080 RepID=A0A8H4RID4_9HELO|nr:hypothetical protein G7Y89_g7519 [Cudoniella acicularis]
MSRTAETSLPIGIAATAAVAGLLSHNLLFIRGEHHLSAPTYVRLGCLAFISFFLLRIKNGQELALLETITAVAAYFGMLFASMTLYRLTFHPLCSFPGPFMFRLSKLWHVFRVSPARKNYLILDQLHYQYGDFVRTGPSELTVFHPAVFEVIGGARTSCIKAPWYDMLYPMVAINSIRDKEGYAPRRRVWDTALNLKAFNKSFGMLDKHEWSGSVQLLRNGLGILGFMTPAPWLAHVAFTFAPKSRLLWQSLVNFAKSMMGDRLYKDIAKKDVSYWMIEAERQKGEELNLNNLYGDAFAVIIAGSHTVATTLIFSLHGLAKNKHMQDRIRAEIKSLVSWDDVEGLGELTFFNAFLNETMRLYPVVPTGGIRMTKTEGITIGDTFIPPETTIVAPRYSLSRLESCFERASEFIPERWTTKPEMIKDKRPYNPFNNGRHSCPGKNLGLMEVRLCLSILISRFDIAFAPGESGTDVFMDMTDSFTANPGALNIMFSERNMPDYDANRQKSTIESRSTSGSVYGGVMSA